MLKTIVVKTTFLFLILISSTAHAQVPVTGNPDHAAMLQADTPELEANKRLVYDFWRIVFEGQQLDRAADFLAEDYIQHNPRVPTGRQGFTDLFKQFANPDTNVESRVKAPLVAIMAEGDLVTLVFVRNMPAKGDNAAYSTTWFDMFRIENGKIAEHWDPQTK
ncbi:nuclear transport factor 2 family protein [Kordiimonas lacus]|uniref:Predicted SnoaL-like aldol condensation-catalyzing enzyme n=1 Tax=Kordiimonas lacus TaxID=637679 RepID=A0A1G6Y9N7_9PROT|nr:nuclear transport factor 2 family protein [Kordiimonas lacus]SDD87012.1 Predicted SnoaL-like aldol condensation-catalyzing enzyme [Kordiimonas lacus]